MHYMYIFFTFYEVTVFLQNKFDLTLHEYNIVNN